MDQDTQDTLTEAFNAAPQYVQDYVRSGKYEEFLDSLRVLGDFHIDTMKIVSDELLMMLLGMTEPRELPQSLKQQADLTDEQVEMVIDYANDEIFAPVREQALTPTPSQASSAPVAPLVSPAQIGQRAPAPVSIPGYPADPTHPAEAAPIYTPPVPVPPPAPVAPVAAPSAPPAAPTFPTPPPYVLPAEPIIPQFRTMAGDVEGLARGTGPAPAPPTLALVTPPLATVAVPPMPVAAPSSIPVPVRPVMAAPPAPTVVPVAPPASGTPNYAEVSATLKQYGIDPYRETPE